MTTTVPAPRADSEVPTAPGAGTPTLPRWLGPVAVAVTVLPIWVAVIRNGAQGWFPGSDAANTVLRARDVFDGPFPLVGMKAAGGSQSGHEVYFPGAWQLYVIAVPTRLFGVVWGPLLAMGLLNTAWVVLTGWLLLRRLRRTEALVGIALLALLLWSIGSGFMISPIPMQMVILPMALLLVSAWAVADGDGWALPVLALVANYLWLGHLVLVVTVPVVVATALIGLGLWYLRRRRDPDAPRTGLAAVHRGAIGAAVVTVIMWIPPVIQQLTTSPGNLRLLVASGGADRPMIGSWSWAIHFVVSLVARPRFWFRGTLRDPPSTYPRIGGEVIAGVNVYDLVVVVLLVGLGVALGLAAYRRGDRTGLWLLVVAAVAVVAAVVTAYSAPTYLGRPNGYLRASWTTAMFVWCAFAVNGLRWLRGRVTWAAAGPALAVIVTFTVANLPTAAYGYDTDRRANRVMVEMNDAVVPRLRGQGPFQMVEGGFSGHAYGASLRLALAQAGVPVCFSRSRARSDGSRLACSDPGTDILAVQVVTGLNTELKGDVLFRRELLPDDELAELKRLTTMVDDWLAREDHIGFSPAALGVLDVFQTEMDQPELLEPVLALSDLSPGQVAALGDDPVFVDVVRLWYESPFGEDADLFDEPSLSPELWRRWAELSARSDALVVSVID